MSGEIQKKYEYRCEDLVPNNVVIKDDIVSHEVDGKINRRVPIRNEEDKGYYIMTEYLSPGSLTFIQRDDTKNGKYVVKMVNSVKRKELRQYGYYKTSDDYSDSKARPTKISKRNIDSDTESDSDTVRDYKCNINKDINEDAKLDNLMVDLNKFTQGLVNRLKYIMKVHEVTKTDTMYFKVRTIKLDNQIMLNNIVEYKDMKNNMTVELTKKILRYCRCRLLIRLDWLNISAVKSSLSMTLVRIYPETLTPIHPDTRTLIMNSLSAQLNKQITNITSINNMQVVKKVKKQDVKDELLKLISKKIK